MNEADGELGESEMKENNVDDVVNESERNLQADQTDKAGQGDQAHKAGQGDQADQADRAS